MKAFRFRLQAVLTLREQAEQSAQQRCALAYEAVRRATARLQSIDTEIAATDESRRAELAAGTRADRLEHAGSYAVLLQERRVRLVKELSETQQQAEAARQQLLLASQRREALERLRARQRRLSDYGAARAEQKVLDELSGGGSVLAETWRDPLPQHRSPSP